MAGSVRTISGELSLKDKFSAVLNKFKTGTDSAVESVRGLTGAIEAAGATYLASKVIGVTKGLAELGGEAELTSVRFRQLAGSDFNILNTALLKGVELSQGLATEDTLQEAAIGMMKFGASAKFVAGTLSTLQQLAFVSDESLDSLGLKLSRYVLTGMMPKKGLGIQQFIPYQAELASLKELTGETGRLAREKLLLDIISKSELDTARKYAELMNTSGAQMKVLNIQWEEFKQVLGETMGPVLVPVLRLLGDFLKAVGDIIRSLPPWAKNLIGLSIVFATIAAVVTSAVVAIKGLAMAFFALHLAAPEIFLITAAIVGLFLIIEDIYTWLQGGESLIGDWLGPWKEFKKELEPIVEFLKDIQKLMIWIFGSKPPETGDYTAYGLIKQGNKERAERKSKAEFLDYANNVQREPVPFLSNKWFIEKLSGKPQGKVIPATPATTPPPVVNQTINFTLTGKITEDNKKEFTDMAVDYFALTRKQLGL